MHEEASAQRQEETPDQVHLLGPDIGLRAYDLSSAAPQIKPRKVKKRGAHELADVVDQEHENQEEGEHL